MPSRPVRAYADTSVYGGVFDEEFDEPSRLFFDEVRADRFRLVISPLVGNELTDALHVAIATVSRCAVIVSWNFKHVVNFERIPLYNGVNLSQGYAAIAIHTPQEVILHEDEDF
jgi:hypothetical protein